MDNILNILQNLIKDEENYKNYLNNLPLEVNFINGRDKMNQDNYDLAKYRKDNEDSLLNYLEQEEMGRIESDLLNHNEKLGNFLNERNNLNVYNDYLNEDTSIDRKGFLRDFQNEYGESFLEYLLKNNKKLTPELIESIEDSEMDSLIDTLYDEM